ncbi:MAG: hypothetical protein M1602_05475, partial [Firmicutes bacterium]|nr:hypothetical protein [Bacillota bacterium]
MPMAVPPSWTAGASAASNRLDDDAARQAAAQHAFGAGLGIARLVRAAMARDGMSQAAIRRAIVMLDSHGLLYEGRPGIEADKAEFALPTDVLASHGLDPLGDTGLEAVVRA